jgi:hypothetical protein
MIQSGLLEQSAANFWQLYRPLCDRWLLMYNATSDAQLVAKGGPLTYSVLDDELFNSFKELFPNQ